MTITQIPVEQCFDEAAGIVPHFHFLETEAPEFVFMRLQPLGDLIASSGSGVQSKYAEHKDKCREALKIARSENADVLITPEYCIPLSLVDEIVSNPDLQPLPNTLWCLCCEGAAYEDFYHYMGKWADHAHVGRKSLRNMTRSHFVGSLLYLFQSRDGDKLCIVPQSKFQPMREELELCERAGLSRGKHVVLFGQHSPNKLVTIICADAYHQDIRDARILLPDEEERKYIVLHPQLNKSPRNGEMTALRNHMFSRECGQHTLYITANWAAGTKIQLENHPVRTLVHAPWSSIYRRAVSFGEDGWTENLREVREHNLRHGLGFGFVRKYKYKAWYSHKQEHIHISRLRKPYGGSPEITRAPGTVLSWRTYLPDASAGWRSAELIFDSTLPDVLSAEATGDFEYPQAASIEARDRFFSYSLGQREADELYLSEAEITGRISYHIDPDCEPHRVKQAAKISRLIRCMKGLPKVRQPSQLKRLRGGYKFHLAPPLNIIAKDPKEQDGALVIYVDNMNEMKPMYDRSVHEHGYLMAARVCVFTVVPFSGEIEHYPTHNDDISALERVETRHDITLGGLSIENASD